MKLLTIDFETHDPYIDRGVGSGWVYGINVPDSDFEVLGAAIRTHDGDTFYETDMDRVRVLVDDHDCLIMHNAQYDLGCLHFIGASVRDKPVFDTEVMSRLYNSSLMSHSLDAVAKRYLGWGKKDTSLTDAIWTHNLYPWLKKEINAKARAEKNGEEYERVRPDEAKLTKFAKKNMKLIQETDLQAMAEYAIGDIDPTYRLYKFFEAKGLNMELAKKYSMLAHICIEYRMRGVRIDCDKAREIDNQLIPMIAQKMNKVYEIAGEEFNINSVKDMPRIFDKLGIRYPRSPQTGNPSITTPWMEKQTHPICVAIVEARKVMKIQGDFIRKILEMQEWTCPTANGTGRIYPELNLLRARTGRFSCSNPNIQQIPSRDPVYGPMCRSIFIPEAGENWYSLDFSNQEGRLQVHYANAVGAEGAASLAYEFNQNPNLDMHQMVADMVGIGRREAKAVNLGLSYGMGIAKLAKSLSMSEAQARVVRDNYNQLAPFLEQLNKKCQAAMKKKGYIKTLGGRHSHIDPPLVQNGEKRTFEYKALNKLIQGSAADQTIECMIQAYKEGIPVLFPVHDQVCISAPSLDTCLRMKEIMETAVKLDIPVVVDYNENNAQSWEEAGH
jgi:DNA polymerase I-like protein with 3'-5' exonuclease and polymerase domains